MGALTVAAGSLMQHLFALSREKAAARRAKQEELWKRRVEDLVDLEMEAGFLAEKLRSWKIRNYEGEIEQTLSNLSQKKGRFFGYRAVWQALEDFVNGAEIVLDDWRNNVGRKDEAAVRKMEEVF